MLKVKVIETYATAKWVSARTETKNANGEVIAVDNEGQSCIALIPIWANWGKTLMDGTELKEGKSYKITIEVDD